ncbi:MAG: InlB B-repeat-containing protein [Lachnospiraceae bacterium]
MAGYEKGSLTSGALKLYPRSMSTGQVIFSNSDTIPGTYIDGYLYIPVVSGYHNPIKNLTITIPLPEHFGSEESVDLGNGVQGWKLEQGTNSLSINNEWIEVSEEFKYGKKAFTNADQEVLLVGDGEIDERYIAFAINDQLKADKSYFDFNPGTYTATQPIMISYDQLQETGSNKKVEIPLGNLSINVPELQLQETPLVSVTAKTPSEVQDKAATYRIVLGNKASDDDYRAGKMARRYDKNGTLTIDVPDTFDPSSLTVAGSFPSGTEIRYHLKDSVPDTWETMQSGQSFQKGSSKVDKIEITLPTTGIHEGSLQMEFGGTTVDSKGTTLTFTLAGDGYDSPEIKTVSWKEKSSSAIKNIYVGTAVLRPVFVAEGQTKSTSYLYCLLAFTKAGATPVYKNLEIELVPDEAAEDEVTLFSLIDTTRITWEGMGEEGSAKGLSLIYTTNLNPEEREETIDDPGTNGQTIDLGLKEGEVLTSLKIHMDEVQFNPEFGNSIAVGLCDLYLNNQSRDVFTCSGALKPVEEGIYGGEFRLTFDEMSLADEDTKYSIKPKFYRTNPLTQIDQAMSITSFDKIEPNGTNQTPVKITVPGWKRTYSSSLTDKFAEGCKLYMPLGDAFFYVGNEPRITIKTINGTRYLVYDLGGKDLSIVSYGSAKTTIEIPVDSFLCLAATGNVELFTGPGYLDYGPQVKVDGSEPPYFTYVPADTWKEDTFGFAEESGVEVSGKRLLEIPNSVSSVQIVGTNKDSLHLFAGLDGAEGGWSTVSVSPEDHDAMTARVLASTSGNQYTKGELTITLDDNLYLRDLDNSVVVNGSNAEVSYLDANQQKIDIPTSVEKIRFVRVGIPLDALSSSSNITVDLKLGMLDDDVYTLQDGQEMKLSAETKYWIAGSEKPGDPYNATRTYQFRWDTISGHVFQESETAEPDGIYGKDDTLLSTFPGLRYKVETGTWKTSSSLSTTAGWKHSYDKKTGIYTVTVKPSKDPYTVSINKPSGLVLTWEDKSVENSNAFLRNTDQGFTLNVNTDGLSWDDAGNTRKFDDVNAGYYKNPDVTITPNPISFMVGNTVFVNVTPGIGCQIEGMSLDDGEAYATLGNPMDKPGGIKTWDITGVKIGDSKKGDVSATNPFGETYTVNDAFTYSVIKRPFITFNNGEGSWADTSGNDSNKEIEIDGYNLPMESAKVPAVNAPTGKAFAGWYKDGKLFDPTKEAIPQGTTLTAHYEADASGDGIPDQYQVIFTFNTMTGGLLNGGQDSVIVSKTRLKTPLITDSPLYTDPEKNPANWSETATVQLNKQGDIPELTTESGYAVDTSKGRWQLGTTTTYYANDEALEAVSFTDKTVTLTAQIKATTVEVSFVVEGGDTYGTVTPNTLTAQVGTKLGNAQDFGTLAVSAKDGYAHVGWKKSGETDKVNLAEEVIIAPVTYEADMMPSGDVSVDNGYALTGHGFVIENSDAAGFTVENIKDKSDADAWNIQTGVSANDTIKVSDEDLAAINGTGTEGAIHEITLLAGPTGTEVSRKIVVVVKGDQTEVVDGIAITAHGFVLDATTAAGLDAPGAIGAAEAKAYVISTGTEITPLAVSDLQDINTAGTNGKGGIFDLTFTAKDTTNNKTASTTVKVAVEGSDVAVENGIALKASDFTVPVSVAKDTTIFTGAYAAGQANVEAWVLETGTKLADTAITVDSTHLDNIHNISDDGGQKDLAFTAADGSNSVTKTITVTVAGSNMVTVTTTGNAKVHAAQYNQGGSYSTPIDYTATTQTVSLPVASTIQDGNFNVGLSVKPDTGYDIDEVTVKITPLQGGTAGTPVEKTVYTGGNYVDEAIAELAALNTAGAKYFTKVEGLTDNIGLIFEDLGGLKGDNPSMTIEVEATTKKTNWTVNFVAKDPEHTSSVWEGTLTKGTENQFMGTIATDGKTASLQVAHENKIDSTPTVTTAQNAGYAFLYWTIKGSDNTYTEVNFDSYQVTGDVTLYAHYGVDTNKDGIADELQQKFTYEISAADQALGHRLNSDQTTVEEWVLKDADGNAKPTTVPGTSPAANYEFTGWTYTGQDTPIETDELKTKDFAQQTTFTANFDRNQWVVTFEVPAGQGTIVENNTATVALNGKLTTDQIPSVTSEGTGYVFVGWTAEESDVVIDLLTQTITGDTTFTAKMMSEDEVTANEQYALTGHGFVIERTELSGKEDAQITQMIRDESEAKAWNIKNGSEADVTVEADFVAIKATDEKGAVHMVTLKVTDAPTVIREIPMVVKGSQTVVDSTNTIVITAHGFALQQSDLTGFDANQAKTKSGVVAYNIKTGKTVGVNVDAAQISTIKNTDEKGAKHGLTFTADTADNLPKITVPVIVAGSEITVKPDSDIAIFAHGFLLEALEAADLDANGAIVKADAKAYVISTGADITNLTVSDLTKVNEAGTNGQGGIFDITFTVNAAGKQVTKTVKAVVKGSQVVIDSTIAIYAHGFSLTQDEKGNFDPIDKAEAEAYVIETGEQVTPTADSDQMTAINDAPEKGGIYDLTFTAEYDGKTVGTTVKVAVEGDQTGITPDPSDIHVALSADHVLLTVAEARTIAENDLVSKANPEAYVVETKTKLEQNAISVKPEDLDAIHNVSDAGDVLDLTLTATDSDSQKTATVTVKAVITGTNTGGVVVGDDILVITAKNFTKVKETLTSDTAKDAGHANAEAYLVSDSKTSLKDDITVDADELKTVNDSKDGLKPLTFKITKSGKTAQVTVSVMISGDGTVTSLDQTTALYAEGFALANADAADLTEAAAKTNAKVSAYLVADGTDLTDQVKIEDTQQLTAIQQAPEKGGIYPLTFSVGENDSKASKTVQVAVKGKQTDVEVPTDPTDPDDFTLALTAGDVLLPYSELSGLTESELVTLAGAQAYVLETNETITVNPEAADFSALKEIKEEGGKQVVTLTPRKNPRPHPWISR